MGTTQNSSACVVLAWLKAELSSERFNGDLINSLKKLGKTESLITNANLNNIDENKARVKVLRQYRVWLDIDFDNYDWHDAKLNQKEVGELSYIDYDYWNKLSNNTGLVKDAVKNIRKNLVVFDVSNDSFHSVVHAIEAGKKFEPIIILASNANEPQRILEGHVRATGFVLAINPAHNLNAFIGTPKKL